MSVWFQAGQLRISCWLMCLRS